MRNILQKWTDICFNPCFNGSMYKNITQTLTVLLLLYSFNPCFNGSMYKNDPQRFTDTARLSVSILVLMDLCIKTK